MPASRPFHRGQAVFNTKERESNVSGSTRHMTFKNSFSTEEEEENTTEKSQKVFIPLLNKQGAGGDPSAVKLVILNKADRAQ